MANPQLEDGHSLIANELVEALSRTQLSGHESRILWAIIRKTYGWHKKTDRISYTQFEQLTGLHSRHIGPVINHLVTRNILIRNGTGYTLEYGLQKNYELWQALPKTVTHSVTENSNGSVLQALPISAVALPISGNSVTENSNGSVTDFGSDKRKKILTKETIQKKVIIDLPGWLDKDSWEAFIDMRKKLRAPPTERAKKLLILELDKLRIAGHDPTEVINQSVMYAWKGLFPIKTIGDKDNARPRANRQDLPKRYTTPEQAGRRQLGDAEWERRHPPGGDDLPDM